MPVPARSRRADGDADADGWWGNTDRTVPPAGGCVGDCDGSGSVAINELTGVSIALDNATELCPSFDCEQTGQVEINSAVTAVNNA